MKSKHVMIVEDDIDIREALTHILKLEGYNIFVACNGFQALEKLKSLSEVEDTPGLIILDLMMPVMDGLTFLREIEHNYKEFQNIPIVVASANLNLTTNPNLSYAVEKICKPLDIEQVYELVRRHCGDPLT
jgi:CheY-like chemotaxis protein